MRPDGFVLAGGRSQRMGVDKARVPFPGQRPMALEVAARLGEVCDRVALVRRGPPDGLPWPGVEVIRDAAPDGDAHPLWGVAAALSASRSEYAVVLSCDVPFVDSASLRKLLAAAAPNGAVGWDGTHRHPLVAVYPRQMAVRASTWAAAGRSARSFADPCLEVLLAPERLADLDRWDQAGRPGPVRALLDGLPWLEGEDRARVERGERARLAAHGVIDPDRVG